MPNWIRYINDFYGPEFWAFMLNVKTKAWQLSRLVSLRSRKILMWASVRVPRTAGGNLQMVTLKSVFDVSIDRMWEDRCKVKSVQGWISVAFKHTADLSRIVQDSLQINRSSNRMFYMLFDPVFGLLILQFFLTKAVNDLSSWEQKLFDVARPSRWLMWVFPPLSVFDEAYYFYRSNDLVAPRKSIESLHPISSVRHVWTFSAEGANQFPEVNKQSISLT